MSIFGRDEEPRSKPAQATAPSKPESQRRTAPPPPTTDRSAGSSTVISAGTRIEGEISGETGVVIDGSLKGRVSVASRVDVGKSGQVRGEIRAESISVAGKVFGNIVGEDNVDIHSTGKLEGDVKAPRVSISDGAYFKGRVEMSGQSREEPSRRGFSEGERGGGSAAEASAPGQSGPASGTESGDQGTKPVEKPPIRSATATPLDKAKAGESAK